MSGHGPRRGLHAYVVTLLGEQIVKGRLSPGERIDLDTLLGDESVSRTALREAIRTLTGKGLIVAQPKTGTFVADRADWHLLDDDVMRWRASGATDLLLLRELGELRQIFEPSVARLAAERRDEHTALALMTSSMTMRELFDSGDLAGVAEEDARFHRLLLGAAGNEILGRFEMMLEPALHARNTLTLESTATSRFLSLHHAVAQAVTDRDGDRAFTAMSTLVADARVDTDAVVEHR